jgi:peptidyl-prolyl cis-trans isomerase D
MLSFLRRKMKIIMWILVVSVTVPFAFWGVGTRFSREDERPRVAGELFGRDVSLQEFDDARRAVAVTAYLNRSEPDRDQINDMAWKRLTMIEAARKDGISVSDEELAATIRKQFSRGGVFEQELYNRLLNLIGVSPTLYERWIREALMIRRLTERIRELAWLPDEELERQLREERTTYTIRYAIVHIDDVKKKVQVSEDEIKAYYDEHKEDYKTPAKVNALYFLVPWEPVGEKIEITNADIKKYYDEHQDEFQHGKRVRAQDIFFKVEKESRKPGLFSRTQTEQRAKEKAEKVLEKLRGGANFAAMARKYSNDEKTKEKGGDLGFIERKDMPPPFTNKAFRMKEGEISDLVKTAQGYYIIKVGESQEPGTKLLEEVRDSIRTKLEAEKKQTLAEESKRKAYAKAVDLSLTLVDNPNLESAAKKFSLEIKETGPFAKNDTVKGIGKSKEFNEAAFATDIGSFTDIIEVPGKGYCIIFPKEKTEETISSFDEVHADIEEKLKEEKAKEKTRELAGQQHEEVAKLMEEGMDFTAACEALSIKPEESRPFSSSGFIPELGFEPELAKKAAGMEPGELGPVLGIKKGACFFTLAKREEPKEEELRRAVDSFRKRALSMEESRMLNEWSSWLEAKAGRIDYLSVPTPAPTPPEIHPGGEAHSS